MNKRDELMKALAHLLEIPGDTINEQTTLTSWDSLAVMSTVVAIDEVYAKVVHGRQLQDCVTVADVLKIAEGA